jgi:ATP-dependent helicase/DNAse subunit B
MTETTFELTTPLTGDLVRKIREHYKLSRQEFAEMCGYKTSARIQSIETKEIWKRNDQDIIRTTLEKILTDPPKDKRGRVRGETADQRIDRLQQAQAAHSGPLLDEQDHRSVDSTYTTWWHRFDWAEDEDEDEIELNLVTHEFEEQIQILPVDQMGGDIHSPAVNGNQLSDVKLLSNSEVTTWERCRRKWWLEYYRKLQPTYPDLVDKRATGNRIHRALAAWYVPEGQEKIDPRDALERIIVEDWTKISKESNLDELQLADLASKYADATSLERAMIEGYLEWLIETGEDENLEVVASETQLSADLNVDVDGVIKLVQLIALIDVRVKRLSDGVRLYVDHKSVQNFADPRKTLHMDSQMLHYHLLEWLNTTDADERCDGALYNMLRKVKRSATARPPFYERLEVHHNEHEIESYRRQVMGAARDILRVENELNAGADPLSVVYKTVGRDCSYMCQYFSTCHLHDDGSRVEDALSALYKVGNPLERYGVDNDV